MGLDLSSHRSQPVTAAIVERSDLVITMSERQRDHCSRMVPAAALSTFTIRELVRLVGSDRSALDTVPAGFARVDRLIERANLHRPVSPRPGSPEDVADPVGGAERHWATFADDITVLVRHVRQFLAIGP